MSLIRHTPEIAEPGLALRPITIKAAARFVAKLHRHNRPPLPPRRH